MLGKEAGNMDEKKRSWVFQCGSVGASPWNRSLQRKVKELKTHKSITIDLPGVLDIKNDCCKITTSISYKREKLLDDFDIKSNHAKIYGRIKEDLGKLFQNAVVNSTIWEYNFFDDTERGASDEKRRNEPGRLSQPVNENGKRARKSESYSDSDSERDSESDRESDDDYEDEEDDDDDYEDEEEIMR